MAPFLFVVKKQFLSNFEVHKNVFLIFSSFRLGEVATETDRYPYAMVR